MGVDTFLLLAAVVSVVSNDDPLDLLGSKSSASLGSEILEEALSEVSA
ncbi:hypothetical protein [Cupriavidus malaysiensis]|nr:hypothetical protein [Cupriavidus malaysiensis]